MSTRLTKIRVTGFRSLKDVELELGPVSVLIGPNGAGKSNLLWALEMVRFLAFESLQRFVGERGGATYLMHYGPKETPTIDLSLEFLTAKGSNIYQARLGYGSDESLVFLTEKAGVKETDGEQWRWSEMGSGHRESMLRDRADTNTTARSVRWLLQQINFYHFHDTSRRSPLRTRSYADAGGDYLRSDGSNLPSFLLGLLESDDPAFKASWRRIQGLVQRVAPFISELAPHEDRHGVRLEWRDDRPATFGPAHLSDGTLRGLALISALAQPEQQMPLVSCIDEPELGLHPAALGLLCGLIKSVAARRQVIVSTQSPVVLDHFAPGQIVVAERHDAATQLRRLEETELETWLEEYTLSELYDKNILGGRP